MSDGMSWIVDADWGPDYKLNFYSTLIKLRIATEGWKEIADRLQMR